MYLELIFATGPVVVELSAWLYDRPGGEPTTYTGPEGGPGAWFGEAA